MNADRCHVRLDELVEQWQLVPSGAPIVTHASCLLPAVRAGAPVMLKTSEQPDEIRGFALLRWWNGAGAVRVLESAPDAVLMERATGLGSLVRMSESGEDAISLDIICQVLEQLHTGGAGPAPPVIPLRDWFASLFETAINEPFMVRSRILASDLLEKPAQPVVLHGDMHHGNVVQTALGAWVAIDPQGLYGHRAFDYANIFRNPSLAVAADPERFRSRIVQVSERSGIGRADLAAWIAALCALSHSWGPDTELPADTDRIVAELALAYLDSQ